MDPRFRDEMGQVTRRAYVAAIVGTDDFNVDAMLGWEQISEREREMYRRVGEAVALHALLNLWRDLFAADVPDEDEQTA